MAFLVVKEKSMSRSLLWLNILPKLNFEDAVFKLINFDEKFQVYNQTVILTKIRGNYSNMGGWL